MDPHPADEHRLRPITEANAFRIGEAERGAACDALAEHFAAGRLDPAELDDRLARAMAARSQADLRVLFSDLRPRRPVAEATALAPTAEHPPGGLAIPVLVSVLVLCLVLAGGMLLVLGAYHPVLFGAALLGGTATAVAGSCVTAIGQASRRRR